MTLAARAKRSPFRAGLACGALHAICFALMFPPVFAWWLAFVALAPLMWLAAGLGEERHQGVEASRHRGPVRRALLGVFLAVMPMWAFHHLWIATVTPVGFPVLIVYLSIYAPLFVWLGARWRRRVGDGWKFWLALPVLWVGLEMVRGAIVWDGYPWFFVGHPVIAEGALGSAAAVTGAVGMSVLAGALTAGVTWLCLGSRASGGGAPRLPPAFRSRGPRAGASVMVVVAMVTWALLTDSRPWSTPGATEFARITVIQTNVPQDNRKAWSFPQRRADFERFKSLTRETAGSNEPGAQATGSGVDRVRPDLIVWPETMFPGIALNPDAVRVERAARLTIPDPASPDGRAPSTIFHDELLALQREIGVPMLVGAIAKDGFRIDTIEESGRTRFEFDATASYNSAFVIAGGEVQPERYDKIKLTPFGEYMPYISWSDWLEGKLLALGAGGMTFDLESGRQPRALRVPILRASEPPHPSGGAPDTLAHQGRGKSTNQEGDRSFRIATPICFEATAPGVCRRLVYAGGWNAKRQADVLINLTNDGWFADSPGGRENHLLLARWRCVELGTPMVRAANTGISCVIDAAGRVTQRLDKKAEGVLRGTVNLPMEGSGPTLYARTGDIVGWFCLAFTAGATALTFVRRPPRTPPGEPQATPGVGATA